MPGFAPRPRVGDHTSPSGSADWAWGARQAPEYARARIPRSARSVGVGPALAIKSRELGIIGSLAFRGARPEGLLAPRRGAMPHGATKRERLEAMASAAVLGGGPTFATGGRALLPLETAGALKHGGLLRKTVSARC
jgi:alkylhydroperoxidase/carboxymuconolactone decarboxylase family protein YurZ